MKIDSDSIIFIHSNDIDIIKMVPLIYNDVFINHYFSLFKTSFTVHNSNVHIYIIKTYEEFMNIIDNNSDTINNYYLFNPTIILVNYIRLLLKEKNIYIYTSHYDLL